MIGLSYCNVGLLLIRAGQTYRVDKCCDERTTDTVIRSAIILAAGMGVRLRELGQRIPKGYICLGTRVILEESISHLVAVGIRHIVVVTGHLAEFFELLPAKYGGIVRLVHNPLYAESGSMYSLYCARQHVDEDFLLLESDLIDERRALTSCLENRHENVVLLSGNTNSSDEIFVETNQEGHLVSMSKNRHALGATIAGEFVGISKVSQRLFGVMLRRAVESFRTTRHVDYETDCLVSSAGLVAVNCHLVEDLIWSEIDHASHLWRARNVVYPGLQKQDDENGVFHPSAQDPSESPPNSIPSIPFAQGKQKERNPQ